MVKWPGIRLLIIWIVFSLAASVDTIIGSIASIPTRAIKPNIMNKKNRLFILFHLFSGAWKQYYESSINSFISKVR